MRQCVANNIKQLSAMKHRNRVRSWITSLPFAIALSSYACYYMVEFRAYSTVYCGSASCTYKRSIPALQYCTSGYTYTGFDVCTLGAQYSYSTWVYECPYACDGDGWCAISHQNGQCEKILELGPDTHWRMELSTIGCGT